MLTALKPREILEHHVQPVAVGQHRVDERLGQVDPAPARLEHPLHQLVDLRPAEDRAGQLVPPGPRHEHPARVVDPDLLHRRVVEVPLERTEAGHPRDELLDHGLGVPERRHRSGQAALVVVLDQPLGEPADQAYVGLRVHAVPADHLTQRCVERLDHVVVRVGVHQAHEGSPSTVSSLIPDSAVSPNFVRFG